MTQKHLSFWDQLTPYVLAGVSIVLFLYLIYVLFFVLLLGSMVGVCLFIMASIKKRFFPTKLPPSKTDVFIEQDIP